MQSRLRYPSAYLSSTHVPAGAILGGLLILTGCASLDPTENIETASSLVEARNETETGWDFPWDERAEYWDGESALSADTAVRIALRNNRAMRRQVETIVATRADYVQAHLLPNPVINAAIGIPLDGLGGNPLSIGLVQQVSWLWMRPVAIDSAEAALQRQVLAVSDTAISIIADVRRAHAEVVYAEQAVDLKRENIELLAAASELMEDRFSVGEASRLDLNRVELDLLRAQTSLSDREAKLADAKRTMLELLARADESANWSTDGVAPDALAALGQTDEARLIQLATTQRLDVAAANAAVEGGLARLELVRRGGLPDVTAGVEYNQNFLSRPGVFPTVGVTPKLFDDNSARVARAASELTQAQIKADRVRQAAIAEARRAWVDLLTHVDVVISYERDIIMLSDENLSLARAAFDAGEADLTILLEAQRLRNIARLELADRQLAATASLIELERAAGGSLRHLPPIDETITMLPDEQREARLESTR